MRESATVKSWMSEDGHNGRGDVGVLANVLASAAMPPSDSPPQKPKTGRSAEVEAREVERRERSAAALRENLRKRKAAAPPKRAPENDGGA
ncbi:hypothetical protein ACFQI3_06255 [Hansschlegelia quercus]|uniref:Uncharacterized protein n=1 Tax=Hansschlegelia quercus TaxID=2528245 RepID=A0A4Q9GKH5_9HYPH|nr:hypothetical protein [Hansschlegelia quercus]TBN53841.1 hypothetical protein EYR15_08585 [Hansschlegelia quercus]